MLLLANFFLEGGIELREFGVTELFLRNAFSPDPTNLQLHLGYELHTAQILDLHAGYGVVVVLRVQQAERRPDVDHVPGVGPDLYARRGTL